MSIQEEISQIKQKLQGKQTPPQEEGLPKFKKRRGFMEMSGVKFNAQRSVGDLSLSHSFVRSSCPDWLNGMMFACSFARTS